MNFKKKIFDSLISIETIVITAVVFVYGFIFYYIPNGISCDEGYYLMGYLQHQELGPMVNDFHNIIRFITPESMMGNVMFYRYLRFGLDFISVLMFGLISYEWLKQNKGFTFNRMLYVGFVLLGGTISYTYTTATISFDHLQHIIYLFAFAFFLAADISKSKAIQMLFTMITGCFVVLAITNYLPSGILLFLVFILFTVVLHPNKSAITRITSLVVALIIGFSLYHILINPINNYIENVITSMRVASDGVTRHDSLSLIIKMLSAIGVFLAIQLPVMFIGFISTKIKSDIKLTFAVSTLLIIALILIRKIFLLQAYLYFIPMSFVLGLYFAKKYFSIKKLQFSNILLIIVLSFLPFMGIFGTNQSIMSKIMVFMPFWVSLFLVLFNQLNLEYRRKNAFLLVVLVLFSLGYFYQGNFRRYHSYYTPRSSKYEFAEGERYKGVKVSAYEKAYYQSFADTLQAIGFKPGDTALAFGEQQIGLYFMGGYFHGPLVYSVNQYVKIPRQKSPYIFLFKKEEESAINQLKNSSWNFPEDYHRIEIGCMAENLDAEHHNTIIYYLK